MKKIKKIIAVIYLALALAFSSPLAAVAQEAAPAQEADTSVASPSPSPVTTNASEASPATEAEPAHEADAGDDIETYGDSDNQDEEEELTREERIDKYYQYLADKEEWERNNSGNVGNTSIETGDASAGGVVVNNANSATTTVTPTCSVCTDNVSVTNSANGSGSDNSAQVTSNNNSSVEIDNTANVTNNLDFTAVSGVNTSSYNVGETEIITGDSNVSGILINAANETGMGVVQYDIIDDQVGDVILLVPDGLFGCGVCGGFGDLSAENTGNGADSTNDATIDSANNTNVDITNDADIANSMDLIADSGHNDTSYNTGGDSSITTGDANVAANLLNFVNSNVIGGVAFVVNIFGDLVGDIIFPDNLPGIGGSSLSASNTGNGSGSDNDATIDLTNQNNVDLANYAYIDNYLTIDGNTGGNQSNYNTGGESSIETGDVTVNAEILNLANINLLSASDEPLWVILVNNMGTWTGKIVGALTGTNYSGSDGLVFTVDENGQIIATNSGNGADSTNNAAITADSTNNLVINNNANITNNVNLTANTGGNRASYNTGGDSSIKTGDANIAASIVNFINSNIIGRTVMVGIVNVFGSWLGDAVPPGEDPDVNNNSAGAGGASSSNSASSSSGTSGSGGNGGSYLITGNSQVAIAQSNSANGNFFGSGGGSGPFFFGGGTDDEDQGSGGGGSSDGAQVLGAKTPNIISLSFNWKLLLISLIPLTLFGIFRYRKLAGQRERKFASISHRIRK